MVATWRYDAVPGMRLGQKKWHSTKKSGKVWSMEDNLDVADQLKGTRKRESNIV